MIIRDKFPFQNQVLAFINSGFSVKIKVVVFLAFIVPLILFISGLWILLGN